MEQVSIDRYNRGSMRRVTSDELQEFCQRWLDASSHTVQYWPEWEREAGKFFDMLDSPMFTETTQSEIMHGVMQIALSVTKGRLAEVKQALRVAAPATIDFSVGLLSHLPHFAAVLEAEMRFRKRMLANDWSLHVEHGGRVVVRTEPRRTNQETEH